MQTLNPSPLSGRGSRGQAQEAIGMSKEAFALKLATQGPRGPSPRAASTHTISRHFFFGGWGQSPGKKLFLHGQGPFRKCLQQGRQLIHSYYSTTHYLVVRPKREDPPTA